MSDLTNPAGGEPVAAPQDAVNPANNPAPDAANPNPQQPATQDTGTPEPQEGQPEEGKDERRKGKGAGEFIRELKGKLSDANARAAAAEAEVARLRQPLRPPGPNASQDEVDKHNVKEAVRESRAEEVAEAARAARQEAADRRYEAFVAKCDAVADRMPGLADKFMALPVVTEGMANFVVKSDKGAEVAFYLTANPHEMARLLALDPHDQGVELGRIEGRLQASPQVRKVSQAPTPVPSMPGAPSPGMKSVSDMSVAEMQKHLYPGR